VNVPREWSEGKGEREMEMEFGKQFYSQMNFIQAKYTQFGLVCDSLRTTLATLHVKLDTKSKMIQKHKKAKNCELAEVEKNVKVKQEPRVCMLYYR